jgi:hypothetical protein
MPTKGTGVAGNAIPTAGENHMDATKPLALASHQIGATRTRGQRHAEMESKELA